MAVWPDSPSGSSNVLNNHAAHVHAHFVAQIDTLKVKWIRIPFINVRVQLFETRQIIREHDAMFERPLAKASAIG